MFYSLVLTCMEYACGLLVINCHWHGGLLELAKGYQLILRSLFINEAYILFVFQYFPSIPPHMQPVTFYLPFLLFPFIFINKCAKNAFLPFNVFALAFANLP